MSKYVPPHLRPKQESAAAAAAAAPAAPAPKRRGIHFPSNVSGLRSHNEHWHRFQVNGHENAPTRSMKAMQQSRSLASRHISRRSKTRKSALKGKKSHAKRATRSASPKRLHRQTRKVKSA